MRRSNHPGEALAVVVAAAALFAFTPGLAAQSGATPQQPGQQQQQDQQTNKTFTGKVQKLPSGQYALVTGQTPDGKLAGHFLDDQEKSKKYEGKQVKVTGSFNTESNTIHVTDIQAPSQ